MEVQFAAPRVSCKHRGQTTIVIAQTVLECAPLDSPMMLESALVGLFYALMEIRETATRVC